MVDKIYCTPQQVMVDSFTLAQMVYDSGYRPTVQATLLSGGIQVGHYVHNFMRNVLGVEIRKNISIESKVGYDRQEQLDAIKGLVVVNTGSGMMELLREVKPDDQVLIVDEVCQTTSTLSKVINELLRQYGGSKKPEVRTAVLHFKPREARSNFRPDYLIHETGAWVVYPWGIRGDMTEEEIVGCWGKEVWDILKRNGQLK